MPEVTQQAKPIPIWSPRFLSPRFTRIAKVSPFSLCAGVSPVWHSCPEAKESPQVFAQDEPRGVGSGVRQILPDQRLTWPIQQPILRSWVTTPALWKFTARRIHKNISLCLKHSSLLQRWRCGGEFISRRTGSRVDLIPGEDHIWQRGTDFNWLPV
jgi:hypothetical protein